MQWENTDDPALTMTRHDTRDENNLMCFTKSVIKVISITNLGWSTSETSTITIVGNAPSFLTQTQ